MLLNKYEKKLLNEILNLESFGLKNAVGKMILDNHCMLCSYSKIISDHDALSELSKLHIVVKLVKYDLN